MSFNLKILDFLVSEVAGWGMPEELRKAYTVSSVPCIFIMCDYELKWEGQYIRTKKLTDLTLFISFFFLVLLTFFLPVDDC